MNNELKPCPLCGKPGEHPQDKPKFVHCSDSHCIMYYHSLIIEHWQNRPAEDALRVEIGQLLNESERVKELYQEVQKLRVELKQSEEQRDSLYRELESTQADRNVTQGNLDDLREMARELKRMYASYLHADSVGCAVEWHGENGEDFRKLESALMKRLTGERE